MRTLAGIGSVFVLSLLTSVAIAVESIVVVPRNSYLVRPVASANQITVWFALLRVRGS